MGEVLAWYLGIPTYFVIGAYLITCCLFGIVVYIAKHAEWKVRSERGLQFLVFVLDLATLIFLVINVVYCIVQLTDDAHTDNFVPPVEACQNHMPAPLFKQSDDYQNCLKAVFGSLIASSISLFFLQFHFMQVHWSYLCEVSR